MHWFPNCLQNPISKQNSKEGHKGAYKKGNNAQTENTTEGNFCQTSNTGPRDDQHFKLFSNHVKL